MDGRAVFWKRGGVIFSTLKGGRFLAACSFKLLKDSNPRTREGGYNHGSASLSYHAKTLDRKRILIHYDNTMDNEPLHNQAPKRQAMKTAPAPGDLLTLDELAKRLRMHPVTARGLYRRKVIPGLKIGHRTLRFDYPAVLAALQAAGDQAAQADR